MLPEELGLEPVKITPLLYNYLIKQQVENFRKYLPIGIVASDVFTFGITKMFLDNNIFIDGCNFIGVFFGLDSSTNEFTIILKRVKIVNQVDVTFEDLQEGYYFGNSSNNFNWTVTDQTQANAMVNNFSLVYYPAANKDPQKNKSNYHANNHIRCGYYIGNQCLYKILKKGNANFAMLQFHIGINNKYDDNAVYNLQLIVNGVDAFDADAYKNIKYLIISFKKMFVTEPASPDFELKGQIILPPVNPAYLELSEYRGIIRRNFQQNQPGGGSPPPLPSAPTPMGASCTLPCPPHGNCQ